jgi:exopolysaccharide biosynthesis WecB/TagA/CpsF family protein
MSPSKTGAWQPAPWRIVRIGSLPIAVLDCAATAHHMIEEAFARRGKDEAPACHTSANGQVISMCANDAELKRLFEAFDLINADGMPMVFASRWMTSTPLPERVATTDLFHDVAELASRVGASFYFLGATEDSNRRTVENVRRQYPGLKIVGRQHGYFSASEEADIVAQVNEAAPDILWIALGVPREQEFVLRHRGAMTGVGLVKTSGGLFDFLSGLRSRAPQWIQDAGLEWLYRTWLEPRRLFKRYLVTNPHAMQVMITQSGDVPGGRM